MSWSAFLDRVLLARAEEQRVCYVCRRALDPELRRAQDRAHKAASLARKRAARGAG